MAGRRTKLTGAVILGLLGGAGLLLLVSLLFLVPRSVTEEIRENYRLVSSTDNGRSLQFASSASPTVTAGRIADEWEPAQRLNDPGGVFLRYQDAIVAVTPDGGQGSRIYVDDADAGYQRWYTHVGGYWGTYSGRAEGFRGGGPAGGK